MRRSEPMETKTYEIIISTCDKFSDLWDANVLLLNRNWPDRNARTWLVTDAPTDRQLPGVQVFSAGAGTEITQRLQGVLEQITTEYVIFTLDDYFLTQPIDQKKIQRALRFMEEYAADYLQMYRQPKGFLRRDGAKEVQQYPGIYLLDMAEGDYKVVLTPGIWRTDFMRKTLKGTLNAWQYEVSLTQTAREVQAICATSNFGEFPYLDVIRKGKLLRKANRYFQKNPICHPEREVMRWKDEMDLRIRAQLKFWLPKQVFRKLKKLMIRLGYTFYSPV